MCEQILRDEIATLQTELALARKMISRYIPGPHFSGDKFHYRLFNGENYQVYSPGLDHWCECTDELMAKIISTALEQYYDQKTNS